MDSRLAPGSSCVAGAGEGLGGSRACCACCFALEPAAMPDDAAAAAGVAADLLADPPAVATVDAGVPARRLAADPPATAVAAAGVPPAAFLAADPPAAAGRVGSRAGWAAGVLPPVLPPLVFGSSSTTFSLVPLLAGRAAGEVQAADRSSSAFNATDAVPGYALAGHQAADMCDDDAHLTSAACALNSSELAACTSGPTASASTRNRSCGGIKIKLQC